MITKVALATCAAAPDLDPDTRSLVEPLAAIGIDATAQVWDDPAVDWAGFALTVIRCCWDYHQQRDRFLAWAASVPAVANPVGVLGWNTHKRYLAELAFAGLPVVPTTWLGPRDPVRSPTSGRWVVKPAVSLAGLDTGVYDASFPADREQLHEHVDRLHRAGRLVMLQPYQSRVDTDGETSLVYLDGRLSHAVRRSAVLHGPDDGADHRFEPPPGLTVTGTTPSRAQVELADRVLDAVPGGRDQLLYARADLVPGPDGTPLLLELELTEPQLFLRHAPGATRRMARAVAARATAARPPRLRMTR